MVKTVKNQSGQMIIESILILVMLASFGLVVAEGFRNNEIFVNLVSGPWKAIDGMVQNGSWGPANKTQVFHPNNHNAHGSIRGE